VTIRSDILALAPTVYWPLDDTSSSTAADASGNGHLGTFLLGSALGAPGPETGTTCLAGAAPDAGVQLAGANPITGNGVQSMLAWFAASAMPSSNHVLIFNGNSATTGAGETLLGQTLNNLYGGIGNGTSGWALSLGFWHMVAFTYDGANVRRQYGDGVLRETSVPFAFNAVASGNPMMGQTPDPGLLAHVAFFNFALSAAQLTALWAAGPGNAPAAPVSGRNATDTDVLALETKLDTILASVRHTYL
jgi:Concanavalin A-like lectin/glucanases superfamily